MTESTSRPFRAGILKALRAPFALSLLLVGCATSDVDPDYRLAPTNNEGVVAGSVTYSGGYSGYGVHYRQFGGDVNGRFSTGQALALLIPKGDFTSKDFAGTVFAVPLPAGEYELHGWSIGSGNITVLSTVPFSIRFKVEPGKMIYAGNFHFTQTSGRGLGAVTGATLTYREAATRDLPIIKAKFQNLANVPIAYTIAPGTQIDHLGGQSAEIVRPIFILLKP